MKKRNIQSIEDSNENDINHHNLINSQIKLIPKPLKFHSKKATLIPRSKEENKQINLLVFKTKSDTLREQNEQLKAQMLSAQNETYIALSQFNASKKKCTSLSQQVLQLSYSQNLIHLRDYFHESQQEINQKKDETKLKIQEIQQRINQFHNKIKKLQKNTDDAQKKNDFLHENCSKLDQKLEEVRAENIKLPLQVYQQNNKLTTDELTAAYQLMASQINEEYLKEEKQLEEEKLWNQREYRDLIENLQALRLKVQQAEQEIQQTKLQIQSHQKVNKS